MLQISTWSPYDEDFAASCFVHYHAEHKLAVIDLEAYADRLTLWSVSWRS